MFHSNLKPNSYRKYLEQFTEIGGVPHLRNFLFDYLPVVEPRPRIAETAPSAAFPFGVPERLG